MDRLIRLQEASQVSGLSRETLRRYADAGKLPVVVLPSRERRFYEADVRALVRPVTR